MFRYKSSLLCLLLLIISLWSCRPQRNLVYLSDLNDSTSFSEIISNRSEMKIQEGDILYITVNTLSPEANALFNKGELIASGVAAPANLNATAYGGTSTLSSVGYLVDKFGDISFPVIGKTKLGGLTLEQARKKLTDIIELQAKNPIVNVRFANFRITVIGEVNRPGTFTLTNDKINLLEAIGLAGDMTVYGKRENILLIRESEGRRDLVRLNMNKKEITKSPYFYLQQNDIVYVEPDNKQKAVEADVRSARAIPLITAGISAVAIILSVVLR